MELSAAAISLRPMTKPRAIIFDWDNTLVSSWAVIRDALNTTLTTYGHAPWSMEETRQRVRKSMRESFPGLFGDKWQEAADVFYGRYDAIHADGVEPIDGISELLSQIDEQGIYQAVVSNKRGDYLRKEAEHLGWAAYFGQIIGADDAPFDKPASEPVHMALQGSGIGADGSVWFVGDSDIDMECAIKADCIPVLLRDPPPAIDEFSEYPPSLHFQNAAALCKRLRTL